MTYLAPWLTLSLTVMCWHGPRHAPLALTLQMSSARALEPRPADCPPPSPVAFTPSFKAASRALGVRRRPQNLQVAEYSVSPRTKSVEIRAMLHGLAKTGQLEPAARIVQQYVRVARAPEERVASIVLNACAERGRMDLCASVVDAMRRHGVHVGGLSYCILIKGHGRRGDLPAVRSTYAAMLAARTPLDLATYNALLDAFARNADLAAAEATLGRMAASGVPPSARTFNTLLKGYARAGSLRQTFRVVARMRDALGEAAPNEVTYSTLVHACVTRGELGRARRVLSWLAEAPSRPRPSAWAYTALMRGLLAHAEAEAEGERERRLSEAVGLLHEMLQHNVRPTQVTTTTLLTACFDMGNITAARSIAALLRREAAAREDLTLAHATDCAMIVGFCRPFQSTLQHGVDPRGESLASRNRGRLKEALQIFVRMTSASNASLGPPDARTCNALMAALVASNEVESAVRVFNGAFLPYLLLSCSPLTVNVMDARDASSANAYSLCILMRGFGAKRDLHRVEVLWRRLLQEGKVDTVALNTYLNACAQCSDVPRALQAFQKAKSDLPHVAAAFDHITFGTLIHSLVHSVGTAAACNRALKLWAEMRRQSILPDEAIVSVLSDACSRHGWVEVALCVRRDLLTLGWSTQRLQAIDSAIHTMLPTLSEMLQDERKWERLGVVLPQQLESFAEVGALRLVPPPSGKQAAARGLGAAQDRLALNGREDGILQDGGGGEDDRKGDEEVWNTVSPAKPSEEIWERHGWDKMEGWRAW